MPFNQLSDVEHQHLDVMTEFFEACYGIHSPTTTSKAAALHHTLSQRIFKWNMENGSVPTRLPEDHQLHDLKS